MVAYREPWDTLNVTELPCVTPEPAFGSADSTDPSAMLSE